MTTTTIDAASQFAATIVGVSSLPDTAVRIMETVQCSDSSAQDLMRVLQGDPSLSARVLKTMNSAAFGVSEKITNLQKAISLLGFNHIRNLALTASISSIFEKGDGVSCYTRTGLWKHMISTAIGARMISRRLELPNPEEAFLGGLLHDIGIILIDQYANEQFVQIIEEVAASGENADLVGTEREILGFDHARLGDLVARQWKFPESVVSVIKYHHSTPPSANAHKLLIQCVQASNLICTLRGLTSIGCRSFACSAEVFRDMGFSKTDAKVIAGDMNSEFEQNTALFELI
ncbi:MAG: HDOD domain-containing protein [Phycisphaerae bacterium]